MMSIIKLIFGPLFNVNQTSKQSKSLWIPQILVFTFCTLFCVLDIVHNVIYYVSYPFTVNTHLDYDQPLEMPSFTICIPNIVDLNQLRHQHPEVYDRFAKVSWDKYYWRPRFATELTIGQLRQMQPVYDEIFVNCTVLNNRLQAIRCESVVPVQHFFSMAKHCYTYFEQHQELRNPQMEYRYGSNVNETKPSNETVNAVTDGSNSKNITIYLQPENELKELIGSDKMSDSTTIVECTSNNASECIFNGTINNKNNVSQNSRSGRTTATISHNTANPFIYQDRAIRNREWIRLTVDRSHLWNQWLDVLITYRGRQFELFNGQPCFLTFSTEIINHAEFTFERTLIQRLSAPFESDCVYYPTQFGCLNRAHCVDICLGNLTLQRRRYWPFYLETIEPQFQLDDYKFEPEDAYNVLRSECSQKYSQPDCEITQQVSFLNRMEMCEPDNVQDEESSVTDRHTNELKDIKKNSNLYLKPERFDAISQKMGSIFTNQLNIIVNPQTLTNKHSALIEFDQQNKSNLNEIDLKDGSQQHPFSDPNSREQFENSEEDNPMPPSDDQLINIDCSSRYVTIVIKYSSEYTTRMVYVPIFDSMQLLSNVGQAVSVYLGLCLYDLHRLLTAYTACSYEQWIRWKQVRAK